MNFFSTSLKALTVAAMLIVYSPNTIAQQLQVAEQQLEQAVKDKDNGKAAFYCYEIAKHHATNGQVDKAAQYLTQCIAFGKKTNDASLMYAAHQELAMIYSEKKDAAKAVDNLQRALKFADELKRPDFTLESLVQLAISQSQLGKFKKSIESLDRALSLSIQEGDKLNQQKCYELLSEYHGKTGNAIKANEYRKLYEHMVKAKQVEDQSVEQKKKFDQQIEKSASEKRTANAQLKQQAQKLRHTEDSLLATKYSLQETAQSLQAAKEANEKRKLEIDLLNKEKELTALQLKEKTTQLKNEAIVRNSFIAGLVLAVMLIVVIIGSYRKQLHANKKIDEQHQNIKSSINYAKRIQEAMLPKVAVQQKLLPDSFVLLKPRDSVSGDFYWLTEMKSWYNPDVVFTVADCTGHGVPGAFMSLIGMNALNGIIGRGIAEVDQVLNELNTEIRSALQQETTGNNDGMDIALCIHRKEKNTLEFSGAKNPLVYIQDHKLFQIKGDVHSIGGKRSKKDFYFKKHIVTINQPTMIYLFSDGYKDQFGGTNNTKFMSKKFNDLLLSIHQRPLQEQKEILNKTIEEWKGNTQQTDDILVMGIRLDVEVI